MASSGGASTTAPSTAQGQGQGRQGRRRGDAATGGAGDDFTAEMRDRQARGKDPYKDDDDDDGGDGSGSDFGFGFGEGEERGLGGRRGYDDDGDDEDDDCTRQGEGAGRRRMKIGQGLRTEPFEDRERRAYALSVLDSPEQLMMFAQSANDTIASQRRRFSAILAGFEPLPASEAAGRVGGLSGGGRGQPR